MYTRFPPRRLRAADGKGTRILSPSTRQCVERECEAEGNGTYTMSVSLGLCLCLSLTHTIWMYRHQLYRYSHHDPSEEQTDQRSFEVLLLLTFSVPN